MEHMGIGCGQLKHPNLVDYQEGTPLVMMSPKEVQSQVEEIPILDMSKYRGSRSSSIKGITI